MEMIVPQKLQKNDEIRIVAPSKGIKIISQECRDIAIHRFEELGLKVSFGKNTIDENFDMMGSSSVEKRVADLMDAFEDSNVKAIFSVIGGANSNQLLPYLDYEIIRKNPKIICGFSDITAILDAISAKTGLVTFYGPHFSSIGMLKGAEYTIENMAKMLIGDGKNEVVPSLEWSDDLWFLEQNQRDFMKNEGYWLINDGMAKGKIGGGNLCTFNLLLGTKYRPKFENPTILFVEDTAATNMDIFARNLEALMHQEDFLNVKGLVVGRFQKESKITREMLEWFFKNKPELNKMPILANVDFGHTTPIITIPIGGIAELNGLNLRIGY